MEQFLQGNVPLRHLLNEETLYMYWQRSAIIEVNDWALKNLALYQVSTNLKLSQKIPLITLTKIRYQNKRAHIVRHKKATIIQVKYF